MTQRMFSALGFVAVLLAWAPAAIAQAAPVPCGNADHIGCSYSAAYGWVAGNVAPQDIVRDPQGQSPQPDAAAQAERDRQAYDQMIAQMAAQQNLRRAEELPGELAQIAAGTTTNPWQSFLLAKHACIDSNMSVGCGHYAKLLTEHEGWYCREEKETQGFYSTCNNIYNPPEEVMRIAKAGCARGDSYACSMVDKVAARYNLPR